MRAQAGLGGEALAADVAVERPVLGALHLGVVVAQVLLQVGQLDEGAAALGQMALVRALACGLWRQRVWGLSGLGVLAGIRRLHTGRGVREDVRNVCIWFSSADIGRVNMVRHEEQDDRVTAKRYILTAFKEHFA